MSSDCCQRQEAEIVKGHRWGIGIVHSHDTWTYKSIDPPAPLRSENWPIPPDFVSTCPGVLKILDPPRGRGSMQPQPIVQCGGRSTCFFPINFALHPKFEL